MGKALLKSKTFWASLITILTGVGLLATGEKTLEEVTITVVGAVFAILRIWTEEPINRLY